MSETFEVGQQVRIGDHADGEITYGPFPSTHGTFTGYVVRTDAGERLQRGNDLVAIPEPPKFSVGDRVTSTIGSNPEGLLVAGPFVSTFSGGNFWVVERDGKHTAPPEEGLTKVVKPEPIKAGDKVRVTDDDGGGRNRFNGREGVVISVAAHSSLPYLVKFGDGEGYHGDVNGTWHCGGVERIEPADTFKHAGITYDLTAKYTDRDGDVWTLARFGDKVVTGATHGETPDADSTSLEFIVGRWGPLTRV
ncbi:phiSA1p31-related protein [Streptomyces sp. NPDC005302]|uniref:phiSA1p31-related protein n=1 Tax=Streptomyces sp. NPDC005302 TaxID=3154675 RepID=UPI0033B67C55